MTNTKYKNGTELFNAAKYDASTSGGCFFGSADWEYLVRKFIAEAPATGFQKACAVAILEISLTE